MQIKVQRLREAMTLLSPAIPRKSPSDILRYVLFMDHKASATDHTVNVMVDLPEVEGAFLLPHKEVLDLLKYWPGHETISIERENGTVVLKGESGTAVYPAKNLADYPVHEGYDLYVKGAINGDNLVRTLGDVSAYCAKDQARPILAGVTLLLGETIQVWASDGMRLANKNLRDSYPEEESITIPPEAVKALSHLWSKLPPAPTPGASLVEDVLGAREIRMGLHRPEERTDGVHVSPNKAVMRFGRITVETNLVEGTPPTFTQVIPTEWTQTVRVIGREFMVGLRRVQKIALASSNIVRLEWEETKLRMSARSAETGDIETSIPVNTDGGPGRVALDVKYLLEVFKDREGLVTIQISGAVRPVGFRAIGAPVVYVMPMFAQWGDEPKEEPKAEAPAEPEPEAEPEDETGPEEDEEEAEGPEEPEAQEEGPGAGTDEAPKVSRRGRKRKTQEVAT